MKRQCIPWLLVSVLLVLALIIVGVGSASTAASAGSERGPLGPAATLVVTSTLDYGPGTLRQVLLDAVSGDTITFDPAIFPPDAYTIISPMTGLPQIVTDDLTIDASNTRVILSGQNIGSTPEALLVDDVSLTFDEGGDVLLNGDFAAGLGHWRPADEGSGATRSINSSDSHSSPNSYEWYVVAHSGGSSTVYDRTDSSDPIDDPFGEGSTAWITATEVTTVELRFWYKGPEVAVTIRLWYPDGDGELGNWSFGSTANWTEAVINETLPAETIAVGLEFKRTHSLWGTAGLSISADRTVVKGLWIGDFPGDGIVLLGGAAENVIGGQNADAGGLCSGDCNLIANNMWAGIELWDSGTDSNTISGNHIGTSAFGTMGAGNAWDGVLIWYGPSHNVVGGDTPGERNLISSNGDSGVRIEGSGSTGNTVSGNYIGTDASGTSALGNANKGVKIGWGTSGNVVGGSAPGEGNLISGNNEDGVHLEGGVRYNVVSGNLIGTDASGTFAVPNTTYGVRIDASPENTIGGDNGTPGGDCTGACNLISGNLEDGVRIEGGESMTNTVAGNYIGTDAAGTAPIPNGGAGVTMNGGATQNLVGGSTAAQRNLITYNRGDGVDIETWGTNQNRIQGNWIGVDADGTRDVAVAHIAHSPAYASDGTIFVGTEGQGLFKTTDGGAHWSEMNGGLTDLEIDALALSPDYASDQTLFVGTPSGVFKSSDGGASWASAGPGEQGEHVYDLALSPDYANDQTVLMGNVLLWDNDLGYRVGGVWMSTDGGATWQNLAPAAGLPLAADASATIPLDGMPPLPAGTWWPQGAPVSAAAQPALPLPAAAGPAGIQQDEGHVDGYAVAFSPGYASDQTLFVGTRGSSRSLFKSTDGGVSWAPIDAGLDGSDVRHIAVSPNYPGDQTLFVVDPEQGGARPFRSVDGGASWSELTVGLPGDEHSRPQGLALSPEFATDGTACAAFGYGKSGVRGFFRSSDGGDTWVETSPGIQSRGAVGAVAVSPDYGSDGELLLSARWSGLLVSYDSGDNWAYANGDLTDPGNGGAGISIQDGAGENIIGGALPGEGNLISNNGEEGILVQGPGTGANEILGNRIGTDASGSGTLGNARSGVLIRAGSSENTIGADDAPRGTACTAACNLVSGNGEHGISIDDPGNEWNIIRGNFVGTNVTGSLALPNLEEGISVSDGPVDNWIQNNLVSGNRGSGIGLSGGTESITITGNYIGVDASGTFSLPNEYHGVRLESGATDNVIGGGTPDARNLISGNAVDGIALWSGDCTNNTISGNYIGVDASGTFSIPNGYYGIDVQSGYNVIGGQNASPGGACTGECNLISGSSHGNGVQIVWYGATSNIVTGNYIGTDVNGTKVLMGPYGEYANGVFIGWYGAHNRLGGATPAERNIIAGMITIGPDFAEPLYTQVSGNYIGLDTTGTTCLARSYYGISLGGWQSTIGGDSTAEGNQICGAEYHGISISNAGNLVAHNEIYGHGEDGIRVSGATALTNTLTHNSIYDNGGLGINLVDGGNTELPAPIVLAYDLAAGTASGTACADCTVEVFADDGDEGRWFITAAESVDGAWSIDTANAFPGAYVHATATDVDGNTSEFSRPVRDVAVVGAAPSGEVVVGEPSPVRAELYNEGSQSESGVPVRCPIEDTAYDETGASGEIQPATWTWVDFPAWTPAAAGVYTLTCQSMLPGDENPSNDVFSQVVTATVLGPPDVWTKDNAEDTGDVPSGHPWWVSPDIWVRHQPDGGLVHQNPIAFQENTVYVQLRNRGGRPASGEVQVFWDRSRIGWPCKVGEPNVGTIPFEDLAPGEVRIVSLTWTPQEVGHHGLHTVIEAEGDPADWSAPCSPHRPRWDNNISWHNVIVYIHPAAAPRQILATEEATVDLVNPYNWLKDADLIIERGTFPTTGTIALRLEETLFDRWLAYEGSWYENAEVNEATGVITSTGEVSTTVGGLPLDAQKEVTATLVLDAPTTGVFEVSLHEQMEGLSVGGLTFQWLLTDPVAPEVETTSPLSGAVNVPPDAAMVITFSERIGPLTLELELAPELAPEGWDTVWNQAGTVVTATHSGFAPGETYTATVTAKDAFANPMEEPYTWSFTVGEGSHLYLPLILRNH